MSRTQNIFFQTCFDPKNSPLGPQKVKNDQQIKSKSKVRIEGTIEYKSKKQTANLGHISILPQKLNFLQTIFCQTTTAFIKKSKSTRKC